MEINDKMLEIEEKRTILEAILIKGGARYKFDNGGNKKLLLTEKQLKDLMEAAERYERFHNLLQTVEENVELLISKGEIDKNIKWNADNAIWNLGEGFVFTEDKELIQETAQKLYKIICRAENHGIVLNYGTPKDPTDVKRYFKDLANK